MMFAIVVLVPTVLLIAAMVRIDLRAHRTGRRTGIRGADARRARRDDITRFDQHKPGGMPPL